MSAPHFNRSACMGGGPFTEGAPLRPGYCGGGSCGRRLRPKNRISRKPLYAPSPSRKATVAIFFIAIPAVTFADG